MQPRARARPAPGRYAASSHRLDTITGPNATSFAYDANGNTVAKGPLSFTYDDTNRMTEALASSVVVGAYVYNGKGERVKKTAGGTTTVFHYDAAGQLIAESDVLGNVQREYVYLAGQLLSIIAQGGAAGTEVVVDTEDAGTQVFGEWPTSTVVAGFLGANYQYHSPNGPSPDGIVVDNGDPGFSTTGTWPTSTVVSGFLGGNYQHHFANGAPPGRGRGG